MSAVHFGQARPHGAERGVPGMAVLLSCLRESVAKSEGFFRKHDVPTHTFMEVLMDPSKPPLKIATAADLETFDKTYFNEFPMITSMTLVDAPVEKTDLSYRVKLVKDEKEALEKKHEAMNEAWHIYVGSL